MLIVRDGVGMAYMGASLYSLPISRRVFLSRSINLGSPMVSPGGDPIVWVFPCPAWGVGEPPVRGDALVFVPGVR